MGRREAKPAKLRFSTRATRPMVSSWPTTRSPSASSSPRMRSRSEAISRDSGRPAILATTRATSVASTVRWCWRRARLPARSTTATALSGRKRSVM